MLRQHKLAVYAFMQDVVSVVAFALPSLSFHSASAKYFFVTAVCVCVCARERRERGGCACCKSIQVVVQSQLALAGCPSHGQTKLLTLYVKVITVRLRAA